VRDYRRVVEDRAVACARAGDLLLWNENFATREARYRGLQEIRHNGATGGCRSFLARCPRPSIAAT
jgi:hypothetical protein